MTYYVFHDSPLGPLTLTAREGALTGLYLEGARYRPEIAPHWQRTGVPFDEVRRQLDQYFARRRTRFELPLDAKGTTFQRTVWRALEAIEYGQTISYGELARRISNPAAVRAVGSANGHNPISIVVPCHRVIGSSGALTGYAGGLAAKRLLLELEAPLSLAA
jgi:methylated-DNA-[protein]-cysteine S-methyltransferase